MKVKIKCKTCGIKRDLDKSHADEHKDLCCDCVDQRFGLRDNQRTYCRFCHLKQPVHKTDCSNRK